MMHKGDYRPDIDGLRAVAVAAVLLYHLDIKIVSGGFVGVDIFFVISGYLITTLIRNEFDKSGNFNFGNFYLRRARRLFPALFTVMLGSAIVSFLISSPSHFRDFCGSLIYALVSISNFYFWAQAGYFDAASTTKPLLHTWSLSVEEQFYLIWPALLIFFLIHARRGLLIFLIVIGGLSLAINPLFAGGASSLGWLSKSSWFADGPATIFYLLPFRVFEFAIGAVVALVPGRRPGGIIAEFLVLIGLGLIAVAVFKFTDQTLFPSFNALLPCVGAALCIYAGQARYSGLLLRNPITVGIGLVSYSLYLVHWPLIVFWRYYSFSVLDNNEKILIGLLALVLAVLMFRFIETPFRRPKPPQLSAPAFGLACSGLAIALIVPAANGWANSGWLWRIPPERVAAVADPDKFQTEQYGGAGFPVEKMFSLGKASATPPRFFVFGDSFGLHYATGLTTYLLDHNESDEALFDHGCPILPGIVRYNNGVPDESCAAEYPKVMEYASANPTVPIIVAMSWSTYRGQIGTRDGKVYDFSTPREYEAFMADRVEQLIEELGSNRRIALVGVPPGLPGTTGPLACLMRPIFVPQVCSLAVTKERGNGFTFNATLDKIAKRHPNVAFWDPYKVMCAKELCQSVIDGLVMYSDSGHFSKDGSNYFIRTISADIGKITVNY